MRQYPSIFNDVIGPVMVGPSSSHTAASVRIGGLLRQLTGPEGPASAAFTFDRAGSLATTYRTQGVAAGLAAGLAGLEPHAPRVLDGAAAAAEAGIAITFGVADRGPGHPNTYYVDLSGRDGTSLQVTALSTGGGMVEIIRLEGFPVSITGGFYEALLAAPEPLPAEAEGALARLAGRPAERVEGPGGVLYRASSPSPMAEAALREMFPGIRLLAPVLPVASQLEPRVPFVTAQEALRWPQKLPLWRLACLYESARSGLSEAEVLDRMAGLIGLLADSLARHDEAPVPGRILQSQSHLLAGAPLLGGSLQRSIAFYVTRFMEIKSAGGVFVAAPTAGSCGCLPGTVFALADELGLDRRAQARCMLAAGLVGVFIARASTFAAEVCGCQAECGAGSGMCAAACAEALGLDAEGSLAAASMALQNIFGMVCDPVANRVEVPCLGKNILGAVGAVASANLAAAGFSQVIPLDETIAALDAVGRALPAELRCTGLGGLSLAPASQALARALEAEGGPARG